MPRTPASPNREILEAALQGLESQRNKLEQQISEVRSLLGSSPTGARRGRPRKNEAQQQQSGTTAAKKAAPAKKRRTLSPEARKRIAAAQKKRWASFRKSTKE